jgi:hypothetical protein
MYCNPTYCILSRTYFPDILIIIFFLLISPPTMLLLKHCHCTLLLLMKNQNLPTTLTFVIKFSHFNLDLVTNRVRLRTLTLFFLVNYLEVLS